MVIINIRLILATASQQRIIMELRNLCKRNYFNGNSFHLRPTVNIKRRLMQNRKRLQ